NLVEPVDDRVAVDRQPLRRHDEIETAFAPGDERFPQHREVVLANEPPQLRLCEPFPRRVLAESSSWHTRMCEISQISTPAPCPASRRASFASAHDAAKAAISEPLSPMPTCQTTA